MLVIVKVPPFSSSTLIVFKRVRSATSAIFLARPLRLRSWASRITDTSRPRGLSTAIARCIPRWWITDFPSSPTEALNAGNATSVSMTAFAKNGRNVSQGFVHALGDDLPQPRHRDRCSRQIAGAGVSGRLGYPLGHESVASSRIASASGMCCGGPGSVVCSRGSVLDAVLPTGPSLSGCVIWLVDSPTRARGPRRLPSRPRRRGARQRHQRRGRGFPCRPCLWTPRAAAHRHPKTSTGKVQKFVLRDKAWTGSGKRIG